MNKAILSAVLLLMTARVAQAGVYEFKSYSFANYGSPFTYVPTTAENLRTALTGDDVDSGGILVGKLNDLLQVGPTSVSDEYDVGGGLHVAFSAAAVSRPAEPLSGAAPGIGAKVSASNNQNPGAATVIGENYVYLKDTVSVINPTTRDEYLKSFEVNLSLDGVVRTVDDAIVQVGVATNVTLDDGASYPTSGIETIQQTPDGLINTYNFGQPFRLGAPLTFTGAGPYGTEIYFHNTRSMEIETLLYVRAQTGGLQRGAGIASADFSNTLRVSNIRFFDENDQVIPGLQIVGSNGDVYPYNVVPEPSLLALFGIGSSGLLLAGFRRTRRS